MKREIKFRAWLPYQNEMVYDFCDIIIDALKNPSNAVIIQQYIGVKDKNGKEIYEGDIIRRLNNLNYISLKDLKNKTPPTENISVFEMIFPERYFWINNNCKVIGNIFEHKICPECLQVYKIGTDKRVDSGMKCLKCSYGK